MAAVDSGRTRDDLCRVTLWLLTVAKPARIFKPKAVGQRFWVQGSSGKQTTRYRARRFRRWALYQELTAEIDFAFRNISIAVICASSRFQKAGVKGEAPLDAETAATAYPAPAIQLSSSSFNSKAHSKMPEPAHWHMNARFAREYSFRELKANKFGSVK